MYFVAWYTLPFFRETKFIFSINLSWFFVCFRSRMPLESSCQSLPGPGSPARSWLPSLPSGAWLDWWAWRLWCGGSWPSWRSQWPLSRKFCSYSSVWTILSSIILLIYFFSLYRAGAAVGAAATANAGGLVAAGGAALSAGAGAVASAASALFGSVSGSGDGISPASASSSGPRSFRETGARPKRKVNY